MLTVIKKEGTSLASYLPNATDNNQIKAQFGSEGEEDVDMTIQEWHNRLNLYFPNIKV